jgi:isoleucyl-tRNA synthetase
LYFDIRKDSLYCDSVHSIERRAARYVMNTIFNHITLLLAPVLPFTTDEAWLTRYPNDDSVHLHDFLQINPSWENMDIADTWNQIWQVKKFATAQIELERTAKNIGSSIEIN